MKRALGKQETQFLAYAQMLELRAVRTGDLMRPLGLTREQERELFRRLARGNRPCLNPSNSTGFL